MKKKVLTVRGFNNNSVPDNFEFSLTKNDKGVRFWWKEWHDPEDYYVSDPGMRWEDMVDNGGDLYFISANRYNPENRIINNAFAVGANKQISGSAYPFNDKIPFMGIALKDGTKYHIFLASKSLFHVLSFVNKQNNWSHLQFVIDEGCTCPQDRLRLIPVHQIKRPEILVKWFLHMIHAKKRLWFLGSPIDGK